MASPTEQIVVGIDNDMRVRQSFMSLMESAGYVAHAFSSAEEFLQSGILGEAVCVITDVSMPGMNGIELQRCIKRNRPMLPVIFVSARQDDTMRERALQAGASAFLYKPFDAADLLKAIRLALAGDSGQ